jgi:SSS family solute:Na+ symporter
LKLSLLDLLVCVAGTLVLVIVGYYSGRSVRSTTDRYFLAGKTLPWYVVGASYVSANISSEQFIGMVGAAFIFGMCAANWTWAAILTITFMVFMFIPFLISSNVRTIPEYLEKRYGPTLRQLFALVTIVTNVLTFMTGVLYAGSIAMQQFFGWDIWTSIIVVGLAAGIWSIYGGLASVAWTGLVHTIVLLVGGCMVTLLGLHHLGGESGSILEGFRVMLEHNRADTGVWREAVAYNLAHLTDEPSYNRLSVVQPPSNPFFPWTGYIPIVLSVSIWYNVMNQFIVQQMLGAKNSYHARMGMVFGGFLQVVLPFIIVLPGLILFSLHPEILMQDWGQAQQAADRGYVQLVQMLIPAGLRGLFLLALFGAIQATVNSVLNSTATIFALDVYKRRWKPAAPEAELVKVGMITMTVTLVLGIALAGMLRGNGGGVFMYIQTLNAFFAPPFAAVFLLGILSRRINGTGAIWGVYCGFAVAVLLKVLLATWPDAPRWMESFLHQAGIIWLASALATIAGSAHRRDPEAERLAAPLVFGLKQSIVWEGMGRTFLSSVYVWWGLLFLTVVALSVVFSGAVFEATPIEAVDLPEH